MPHSLFIFPVSTPQVSHSSPNIHVQQVLTPYLHKYSPSVPNSCSQSIFPTIPSVPS